MIKSVAIGYSYIIVAAGLEFLAEEEITEKLHATAIKRKEKQGQVYFATDAPLHKVKKYHPQITPEVPQ